MKRVSSDISAAPKRPDTQPSLALRQRQDGGQAGLKVTRASRSDFENNPDRDGLATVWTPAALRATHE